MSQSRVDVCRQRVAHVRETYMHRQYDEDGWRERGDAYLELGKALVNMIPSAQLHPSRESTILSEVADAYDQAEVSYRKIDDGDGVAETFYQRAWIYEHILGTDAEFLLQAAIDWAINKRLYYETELANYLERRAVKL